MSHPPARRRRAVRRIAAVAWLGVVAACTGDPPPAAPAPPAPDTTVVARLDRALAAAVAQASLRGASAAVITASGSAWRGATGASEPGTPLAPTMRLGLGSITKNVVATLLVRRAEQGTLRLDDRLSRWLGAIPQVSPEITVRELLNHSSGVFDVTDAPGYRDSILADPSARWTPQRTLRLLSPPLFAPGRGWSYSNSNYLLAGLVAEAAGGPLHLQLRRELFEPFELRSFFLDQAEAPTGPLATGWVGNTVNLMASPRTSTYSAAWAAGALFATAEDTARWLHALLTGRIVGPDGLAAMQTPVGPESYGLGMSRRVLAGRSVWGHSGEIRGYTAMVVHDPERRTTVAVLANQNPGNVRAVVEALLAEALRP